MTKTQAIKTAQNAINIVYFGGWCVMQPFDYDEPNGARSEVRCIDYREAVNTARQFKISLAVYLMETELPRYEVEYWLTSRDISGEDWRTIARRINREGLEW